MFNLNKNCLIKQRMKDKSMKIPPAKPWFPEEDLQKILEDIKTVLQSGMLTLHKVNREFESEYANGTMDPLPCNSWNLTGISETGLLLYSTPHLT